MMRNPMLAVGFAAALALVATGAQAQTSNSNSMSRPKASSSMKSNSGMAQKVSKDDRTFLKEAIEGDMAEVQAGKLAQQNGQSENVKQFGQMLEQDHGQHLQKTQAMAQKMNVTGPSQPSAEQKETYTELSKEHGARFDKKFTQDMVQGHKKTIFMYKREAKKNGPLAQFAQQTIPMLQKHLQTAESIENKGAMTGSKSGTK